MIPAPPPPPLRYGARVKSALVTAAAATPLSVMVPATVLFAFLTVISVLAPLGAIVTLVAKLPAVIPSAATFSRSWPTVALGVAPKPLMMSAPKPVANLKTSVPTVGRDSWCRCRPHR